MLFTPPSWLTFKFRLPLAVQLAVQLYNLRVWMQNRWRRIRGRKADYVYLELTGYLPIVSDVPSLLQRVLGATTTIGFGAVQEKLRRIATDPYARGVVLVLRNFSPSWAMAENLRTELQALRAADKQVIIYIQGGGTRLYYLACAANTIVMPPSALLWITGLRMELTFVRDALQMIGLEAEVTAVSPYKSAGDSFTRSNISPEAREQSERLLESRFSHLVAGIAQDRNLDAEQVRHLIDTAPHSAERARELGLIDAVCYTDEIEAYLNEQAGKPTIPLTVQPWSAAEDSLQIPYRRFQSRSVAIIPIEGTIVEGEVRSSPLPDPLGDSDQVGSESVLRALRQVERDNDLAAAVLYIDSPGGDAFASDLIWRDVLRLSKKKPVVAYLSNVAASGGYYIALPAKSIVAHPTTLTGSIGVLSLRPTAHALLERVGINTTVLQRGARADLLNVTQAPTDDERQVLQQGMQETYAQFKQRVCTGRTMKPEALEPLAGGRVWTGSEAVQHGFVDLLGGLPEAVEQARTLARIAHATPDQWVWVRPSSRRGEPRLPPAFPRTDTLTKLLLALATISSDTLRPRTLLMLPWLLHEED